ncbi:leucine-rich melanocyte differentiation-associated protein-like [Patiria miniata]|uniref:Leucine-rich melanocyte differentiation-associated protein n=1 Tax=Patiria miniata TaxID=46514 RepID=A0A914ADV7_PATMI|nr:leucine-rich melanocyte differentiation-associated protein-like [Patiria miniata]
MDSTKTYWLDQLRANRKNMANVTVTENGESGQNESLGPIIEGTQLSYLEHSATRIPDELGQWYGKQVTRLDLSFNHIRSLEGLERFIKLEELVLDQNELNDSINIPPIPTLQTLVLNKNRIKDLERLTDQLKQQCPNLTYLSLLGNEACPNELSSTDKDEDDYQRYRYYVVHKLPGLRFLDSRQVTQKERKEADRVGSYMRVVRVNSDQDLNKSPDSPDSSHHSYGPLPDTIRPSDNHQGTFGKCRYVYYGRHSEGNRFIRNNDL